MEETSFDRQMMEQLRRTPEGREAVRELTRRMIEGLKPAIDVILHEDDG